MLLLLLALLLSIWSQMWETRTEGLLLLLCVTIS
jgi:hypothetical protein